MPTSHFWREWEGHTIAGQHRLVRLWGNTEQTAVFAAEKEAVKLISQEAAGSPDPLDRFEQIRRLPHPNLMPLVDYGTTPIDGQDWYYIVTEQANDDLSKLLEQRALTPEEARDVIGGVVPALQYLHAEGFLHGALKPSNVMLVQEQLKISSDSLQAAAHAKPRTGKPSPYDPPEFAHGEISPKSDIWMVGVLLFEGLTQSHNLLASPHENLPEPFSAIVSGCLRKDPSTRLTPEQIQDLLNGEAPAESPSTQQLAEPVFATIPNRVMPPMSLFPRLMLIAAAMVVAVACYLVLGRGGDTPQAASPEPAPAVAAPAPDNPGLAAAAPQAPVKQKKKRNQRRHK